MRVLLTTDPIGGVWTFTKELTVELLGRTHAVALVSFGRRLTADQQNWCSSLSSKYRHRFTYRVSDIPLEWMQDNDHASTLGKGLLLEVAEVFLPDVIHSSQYCFGSLPLDVPIVITAHSDIFSWARSCRHHPLEPSQWLDTYRRLVQSGLASADVVVAPTEWMLRALSEDFTLPNRSRVIPNGRSLALSPTSTSTTLLQAISCGRLWDEAKDIGILSEMSTPFPIYVAGDNAFNDSSCNLKNLKYVGRLDEAALLDAMRASAIYIATSIYEPFGLAPLEAALCGCAIIARNIPTFREVWKDAALYFNDAAELERYLLRYEDNPRLLQERQGLCQQRAKAFSGLRMAQAYEDIYYDLAASKSHVPLNRPHVQLVSHGA